MSFAENLKAARRAAGLMQSHVANALHISVSAYCGYETGKRQPDLTRLCQLSDLLGVPVGQLLGQPASSQPAVSEEELAHIEQYRALDAHGKRLVDLVTREELSRLRQRPMRTFRSACVSFRISEQPAAAGMGAYLGPDAFRTVQVRRGALPRGASFGVPVCGDSMEPAYHDRDILIVSDSLPEPGDVGVFIMDGAGYVKLAGHGELLSLNPAYAPIPMAESIRPCGKVVGVLSPSDIV